MNKSGLRYGGMETLVMLVDKYKAPSVGKGLTVRLYIFIFSITFNIFLG